MRLTSYREWESAVFEQAKADVSADITLTDIWRGYETLSYGKKQGSDNSAVRQIQKKILIILNGTPKLKDWAIKNEYKADGDFGKKTASALGLILNGKPFTNPENLKIGPKILKKLGLIPPKNYSPKIELLATTLVVEAGNGGNKEIQAVANVIANRVKARGKYTVTQTVLEKNQFSLWNPYQGKKPEDMLDAAKRYWRPENKKNWGRAVNYAKYLSLGTRFIDNTKGATHYYNPKIVFPKWAKVSTWKKHEVNLLHTYGRDTSVSWAKKPVLRS